MDLRVAGKTLFVALLLLPSAVYTNRCFAQGTTTSPSGQQNSQNPQGQQQNQTTQTAPYIVAAPGATVSTPAPSSSGNPGLVVAAPGSTVVVQSAAAQSQKSTTTNKPNSFSLKTDSSTVSYLGQYAVDSCRRVQARGGAIDALGQIGGADQATDDQIACILAEVLNMEFIAGNKFKDANTSEFLCFHAVVAAENLGWGGRAVIPQLQLLRGQSVLLDAAIDHAVSAMQNAQQQQQQQQQQQGGGNNPMGNAGQ